MDLNVTLDIHLDENLFQIRGQNPKTKFGERLFKVKAKQVVVC